MRVVPPSGVAWQELACTPIASLNHQEEKIMPKKSAGEAVYRIIELVGTSTKSWEDAAMNAIETASHSLRDLRVAEVVKMDMKVDGGKVAAFRTRMLLSFKYEGG
jgi:dodecin